MATKSGGNRNREHNARGTPEGRGGTGARGNSNRGRDTTGTRAVKPGDEFGKLARKILGLAIPGIPGALMGAGMLVGDAMGDKVFADQQDVDAGRKKSRRMDDPAMGRVDDVEGQGLSSFGNAMADDRTPNANGLGRGTTSGAGADSLASAQAAEERKRRRAAAQKTALGSISESKLGPGVLPI